MPTTEQIQAQFAAYQAEGRTPAEARQGCRVWTKEQLAEERASTQPYALRPLLREYRHDHPDPAVRKTEMTAFIADENDRIANSLSSVTDEHHLAASRHNAWCMTTPGMAGDIVAHGHHFAQKEWGKSLWVEADKLVVTALGGA